MLPIETTCLALAARRPLTQPTSGSAWRSRSAACAWPRVHARRSRADDRRERAVDVEQHRGLGGVGAQGLQCLHQRRAAGTRSLVSPSMVASRPLRLMTIGTAAGLFSGIFGVGGGSVIVPLLGCGSATASARPREPHWRRLSASRDFAAAVRAGYGNVRIVDGLLVGIRRSAGCCSGRGCSSACIRARSRCCSRGAGRERGGAAPPVIGAIVIGGAAGVVAGLPVSAGACCRARPRDLPEPRPNTRRRRRPCWRSSRSRSWGRSSRTATATSADATGCCWAFLDRRGAAGVVLATPSGEERCNRLRAVHGGVAVQSGAQDLRETAPDEEPAARRRRLDRTTEGV